MSGGQFFSPWENPRKTDGIPKKGVSAVFRFVGYLPEAKRPQAQSFTPPQKQWAASLSETAPSDCRKTIFYAEFTGQNVGALIERPLKIGKMIGILVVFSDFTKHIGKKLSPHFRAINDRPYKSMEDNWLF